MSRRLKLDGPPCQVCAKPVKLRWPGEARTKKVCSVQCTGKLRTKQDLTLMEPRYCTACQKRLEPKHYEAPSQFAARSYCDRACRQAGMTLWQDWELEVELEHLLGTDTPDSIAKRLGYADVPSLAIRLSRNGQHELRARLLRLHSGYVDEEVS